MKKIIKLTESDLTRIVKQVIKESAPERNVVDSKTGELIGTHKHGVGFKPNKLGREKGHEDHPTSIPNYTKFDDRWNDEMSDEDMMGDERPKPSPRMARPQMVPQQLKDYQRRQSYRG
jgi:hypothetical protein